MGLTTLGTIHTAIGLVALGCGLYALVRFKEIAGRSRLGIFYFWTTMITAATGLGIFQHGGFGPPHVLSILTILALIVAFVAVNTHFYGRFSRHTEVGAYTTTVLFHLIPGFTETLTRLPAGNPIASSQEAPILKGIAAVLFVAYVVVLGMQLRRINARPLAAVEDDDVGHA